MIVLDQLKFRLGSVNIGLDWLISVSIGSYRFGSVNVNLDWLILVNIGLDWLIGLDGLNIKEYQLILVRVG